MKESSSQLPIAIVVIGFLIGAAIFQAGAPFIAFIVFIASVVAALSLQS